MTDVKDFCSQAPGSASLGDISQFFLTPTLKNPISSYKDAQKEIIQLGALGQMITHPHLGRLLLVGSVSAFENYCRGVLSSCLDICPIAQSLSSEKNTNLGGAIWHGRRGNFNRSAFEHKSFTDSKELKSCFKEYLGIDIGSNLFSDYLSNFDRIMHLRHAIVHADGILPGRNAVKLEIPRSSRELSIAIDMNRLQEVVLVLSGLVHLLNREIFNAMCDRWTYKWRARADWEEERASKTLGLIYDIFIDDDLKISRRWKKQWTKRALEDALLQQL
ncbi:HEPN domain-containing protein [Sphingobium sp.]|uniref:HEPN domain-containing protein n=1 Tax=Sphingobium sp. TaxID=1912891 RepID=UPI003BB5925F